MFSKSIALCFVGAALPQAAPTTFTGNQLICTIPLLPTSVDP